MNALPVCYGCNDACSEPYQLLIKMSIFESQFLHRAHLPRRGPWNYTATSQLHGILNAVVGNSEDMMTSSNWNISRVTGPLCREFTGHHNPPHKGQWRGGLVFSLICARANNWANDRDAGHLRRQRAHYDVIVMRNWQLSYYLVSITCGYWSYVQILQCSDI